MAPTELVVEPVAPSYGFEGSEKRIEVDFEATVLGAGPTNGLRALSRAQLDELLTYAHCCIVSVRNSPDFDAYVLSESSLFVYATKAVLKTCGTTALLTAVPKMLELAASVGLKTRRCKYSRACFKFPEAQPAPHGSFEDEVAYLEEYFGHLGAGGKAYVLGSKLHSPRWHVYTADAAYVEGFDGAASGAPPARTFTLEVCMTDLDPAAAAHFIRGPAFVSAAAATADSGIAALLPKATIDDYVFEPCGYSMNGLDGAGFLTIHITPEADFSYASVEVSGFAPGDVDPVRVAQQAADIFRPGRLALALSWDGALTCAQGQAWDRELAPPAGYSARLANRRAIDVGGGVAFAIYEGPKELAAHSRQLDRKKSELFLEELAMTPLRPHHEHEHAADGAGAGAEGAAEGGKAAGGATGAAPEVPGVPTPLPAGDVAAAAKKKAFADLAIATEVAV